MIQRLEHAPTEMAFRKNDFRTPADLCFTVLLYKRFVDSE